MRGLLGTEGAGRPYAPAAPIARFWAASQFHREMPAMTARRVVLIVGAMAGLVLALYFANPFHTPSLDPRIRLWGVTLFRRSSRSMERIIHENEVFLVWAWPYLARDPQIGDVVVFQYPLDRSVAYVKRVITAGGSTVEMREGIVILDGRRLSEPYLSRPDPVAGSFDSMPAVDVPQGHSFVLGDNRNNSADSRLWDSYRDPT